MNNTVAVNKEEESGNCVEESKAKFFGADVSLQ